MRRFPLLGLVGALALLNAAWMPTDKWQPVPDPVMAEINTFFTSMDQDLHNQDATSILAHYTPDITLRIETPDGVLLASLDEPWIRKNIVRTMTPGQPGYVESQLPHRRQDFQYQPGPDNEQFAVRYNHRTLLPDGSLDPRPFVNLTCIFVRGPMGLRISMEISRTISPEVHGERPPALQPGQRIVALEPVTTTSTIPPSDKDGQ